jgi:queuine tRNA-ribosyltransferase
MKALEFIIQKKLEGTLARAGQIVTPHGVINTPSFVVVGTKGTVKAMTPEQLQEVGAQVTLCNTYHLYLQPGDELIRDAGGLHKFMNWHGPMMTDSGGFQVFSLGAAYGKELSKFTKEITNPSLLISERSSVDEGMARLATIGNDGVSFRSHIDGSLHYITPEKSIEIQHNLGADIIFAFDEATSPAENYRYQDEALSRTHAWAKRSLERHKELELEKKDEFPQALFGIVQGGLEQDLRKKSAEYISSLDFDGFGIGGSYSKEHMALTTHLVNAILPENKPRHLLGIGEPEDLFMGVENGVDLFDCVGPTRIARTGTLFTHKGKINISNAQFVHDFGPIDEHCECSTCKRYTRAYLSHLFRAKEMLAATLASIHNEYFINHLVARMRETILEGTFFEFKKEFLEGYLK